MQKQRALLSALSSWYAAEKRELPWRQTTDPYRIWVSEIMLQQTQVSRVIEYYARFLKRFPSIADLAKVEWEELLPYWRGLGFYSRGKNMLKTAQIVVEQYGGIFPTNREKLMELPGIAEYTSAAILSFAYNKPIPALDTNIKRVLKRVFACTEKGVGPRAEALFAATEDSEHISAADLNHALMDLGAAICQSRKVQCEICPLNAICDFHQSGRKAQWEKSLLSAPSKKVTTKKPLIEVAAACIHRSGKYLICKRTKSKGDFWEFPGGKREQGEDWRHALKREITEELGVEISVRPHFFEEFWEEKEFAWRLRFFRCQILHGEPQLIEHETFEWVLPQELEDYEFPRANAKAITRLIKMRMVK